MTDFPRSQSSQIIEFLIQANWHLKKREYRLALKIYHDVITQFGETADLDQALANCYFQLASYERDEANYQSAINWVEKATALDPNNSQLHANLGQYHSLGTLEYQEAAQEYRVAIELNPNNLVALVGGSALYGVPEKVVTLDEAIAWLSKVVQIEPNDPNYHFRLGTLYYEAGLFPQAEIEWLKALLCPRPLDLSPAQAISKLIGAMNA
jgi:tetratricopeptide (TPR) repeat protein